MSVIAIAMVSRMPTISAKNLVIRREFVSLILAGCGIIVALIIIEPWLTLPFLGLTYIAAIPFGIIKYKRAQNALISTDNIP
jgi:CDP-diacylglycerol--serine O-phosphatidyltransferase